MAVTDAVALVRVSGRASFNCSVDFKTLVYELRDRGYRKFVLDLTECPIIDSTFLGEPLTTEELAEQLEDILGEEIALPTVRKWKQRSLDRLADELRDQGFVD